MKASSFTVRRVATDERAFRAVVDAAREAPNGEIADVERTIAAYEKKYAMSSADARASLARGELSPTREVEGWMMAVRVRDHLAAVKARAR